MNEEKIVDMLIESYDIGRSLSSCLDVNFLNYLASCDLDDIRIWLAKALINDDSESVAVQLLCELSQDKEPLVRAEAVDSLRVFVCQESFHALRVAIRDSDELVRAYAVFGIAMVGETIDPVKTQNILQDLIATEDSFHVLIGAYEGLYLLGQKDYLAELFNLFKSDNYSVQCSVLHALEDILDCENRKQIQTFLTSLSLSEYPYAVSDTILQVKQRIEDSFQGQGQGDGLREPF